MVSLAHPSKRGALRLRCWLRGFAGLLPLLLTSLALAQGGSQALFVEPEESSAEVPEGHLSLRWEVEGEEDQTDWIFELEQSFEEDFTPTRSVYVGPDAGTFVSGLPHEGAYFRVRARHSDETEWGAWSPPLRVTVAYPPSWQVAALGISGLVMFGILLGAIIVGSRRSRRHSLSAS